MTNHPEPARSCEHENFHANVAVGRLTKGDDGPVTGYTAEVRIHCAQCGLPFEFMGLPVGLLPDGAAVSVNAQEARLAIAPHGVRPSPLDMIGYRIRGLSS